VDNSSHLACIQKNNVTTTKELINGCNRNRTAVEKLEVAVASGRT
jgi:hypothetical protein